MKRSDIMYEVASKMGDFYDNQCWDGYDINDEDFERFMEEVDSLVGDAISMVNDRAKWLKNSAINEGE